MGCVRGDMGEKGIRVWDNWVYRKNSVIDGAQVLNKVVGTIMLDYGKDGGVIG